MVSQEEPSDNAVSSEHGNGPVKEMMAEDEATEMLNWRCQVAVRSDLREFGSAHAPFNGVRWEGDSKLFEKGNEWVIGRG